MDRIDSILLGNFDAQKVLNDMLNESEKNLLYRISDVISETQDGIETLSKISRMIGSICPNYCRNAQFFLVILYLIQNLVSEGNMKYRDVDSFLATYPQFANRSDLDNLIKTANWMKILFQYNLIVAKKNKGIVLAAVSKFVEGYLVEYITGSGQKRSTSDRVHIYEKEGNVIPQRKRDRSSSTSSEISSLYSENENNNNTDNESVYSDNNLIEQCVTPVFSKRNMFIKDPHISISRKRKIECYGSNMNHGDSACKMQKLPIMEISKSHIEQIRNKHIQGLKINTTQLYKKRIIESNKLQLKKEQEESLLNDLDIDNSSSWTIINDTDAAKEISILYAKNISKASKELNKLKKVQINKNPFNYSNVFSDDFLAMDFNNETTEKVKDMECNNDIIFYHDDEYYSAFTDFHLKIPV